MRVSSGDGFARGRSQGRMILSGFVLYGGGRGGQRRVTMTRLNRMLSGGLSSLGVCLLVVSLLLTPGNAYSIAQVNGQKGCLKDNADGTNDCNTPNNVMDTCIKLVGQGRCASDALTLCKGDMTNRANCTKCVCTLIYNRGSVVDCKCRFSTTRARF